ncbi:hypothetical protein SAY87_000112 [Trapa incisa]|uniref:Gfo/Idh/MocA-like oxidoreductase N-terminal domain-containing protein n=1 Tax=Trapa incisa TaxID=236973 RepID=A0AAN7GEU2_9MYRT|nr:hypothetical protein SAY87_000112 [Trapa incisa]
MSEAIVRFGIIGCAEIARKVSRAITLAPNSTIYAVASRSLEKASNFAAQNSFPPGTKIYGTYDALLEDPDVDAVYLPLPTSLHIRWAVAAACKGKHILLEKPVAMNVAEFDEIVKACSENGVQLMDGTMWMHHPRTAKMKEFLLDKAIFGDLKSMHTCFTFGADADFLANDIRVKPHLDGLGSLGDAGWYCIRSILWLADFELPETVTALPGPVLNDAGVILSCGASLRWKDGKVATFHCSFLSHLTMDITAIGSKGTLHVHDFIIPFQEEEASFSIASEAWFDEFVTKWTGKRSEHVVKAELPQEACMVKEFSSLVNAIRTKGSKPEMKWPTISRKTQLVLDSVKQSIEQGFVGVGVLQ